EIVSREALERIAQLLPKPDTDRSQTSNGANGGRFDLDGFLQQHNIVVKRTKPWHGAGRLLILEHCVFNDTHTRTAVAIMEFPSGALGYRCQHQTCHGKRWQDVREQFEPGYQQRCQGSRTIGVEFDAPDPEPTPKAIGNMPTAAGFLIEHR